MQLLSINVGWPQLVQYQGRTITTAIFKLPVEGQVEVTEMGLAGDEQADKSVHGGVDKAVYAYDTQDYQWWQQELDGRELAPGEFGENLTVQGLPSDQVCIGDRYRIGTVLLEVTQPRQPCAKLGVRMQMPSIVKQFHQAGRPGFYLRVLESGTLTAGDSIERVERPEHTLSIPEIYRLRFHSSASTAEVTRAANLTRLSESWRDDFCNLLESR
ncbi:MOSC domain-containing protein [Aeoliella sp. ICT_H6.2]|uniref:MOSC domain-containing protein n=1 Tax=Aeoliella straminimaris TaxID=2954799 RepID=A0A9X2FB05_9BACT|nr:MOSC domain-containing protein [Aeoliella straminimaris]MCO6043024.1 MOSC domain-containing protein [Aeoliella straminimaris]